MSALLEVRELRVEVRASGAPIVAGASLGVARGEIVALVGESGSGKSTLAFAIPRLLSPALAIAGGAIELEGRDLVRASDAELRQIRGARVGCVFQDSLAALNPVTRIGAQVAEGLRHHRGLSRAEAELRVATLFAEVELVEPARVARSFAHQLSGGMRQRAALAMALALEPALLIADEPTSALDAATGVKVLALLRRLARGRELGVLLVTHDLRAALEFADRVVVMYAGACVESAPARELAERALHPYTRALLAASLHRARRGEALRPIPGAPPPPHARPAGCAFHPRCVSARAECSEATPEPIAAAAGRTVACPFHGEQPA